MVLRRLTWSSSNYSGDKSLLAGAAHIPTLPANCSVVACIGESSTTAFYMSTYVNITLLALPVAYNNAFCQKRNTYIYIYMYIHDTFIHIQVNTHELIYVYIYISANPLGRPGVCSLVCVV